MTIENRKDNHIDICVSQPVNYSTTTLFEYVSLVHDCLPEINYSDIDTRTTFLGKEISSPIIINSMTGGTAKAHEINNQLASFAEKHKLALGIGSMRPLLEKNSNSFDTFDVRKIAPSVPLFGNIGMAQLRDKNNIKKLVDLSNQLELDGFAVHLNPLQEIVQKEGDTEFNGCLAGIADLRKELSTPIIVKETGAGINEFRAKELSKLGVDYIDVSGSGGTSWSRVEYLRKTNRATGFEDWGIPSAFLVATVANSLRETKTKIIASGGIYDGITCAKAISLGADYCAVARKFIQALLDKTLESTYLQMLEQLKIAMLLTSSTDVSFLKRCKLMIYPPLKDLLEVAGLQPKSYYYR